jgi:hypothetical protein
MKFLPFLALIFAFSSCMNSKTGSGNIIKETRSIGSFKSIDASNAVHVDVTMGAKESVVVEADDNIMPYVETNISGGTLKIKLRGINNLTNATINVHVTMQDVNGLNASSAASIESKGMLTGSGKIDLESSSAAKVDVELDAPSVTASASSAGEINAKGRTKSIDADASSGASVKAQGLHAENARAEASSGASVSVFASVSIDGTASSGGDVKYTGGAATMKVNESSGGSVKAN